MEVVFISMDTAMEVHSNIQIMREIACVPDPVRFYRYQLIVYAYLSSPALKHAQRS